jgi:predicted transcriptional regulator
MTTAESGTNHDEDGSDFVRPGLTLGKRQDALLDELRATRYASRSEAARAAIESLAKDVLSDGKTGIERISKQLKQLEVQMNELADRIDEIQKQLRVDNTTGSPPQQGHDSGSNSGGPTVGFTETQGSAELQHAVYAILSEHGEMSIPEIAERVDGDPFDVHDNIEQLVENHGFVMCTEQSDAPRYKIKKPGSN